ncbi:MAG: sensor histidine kinase N-terminal domain-containing protein, partial [Polaromonas sp.]|nr:sensor histidine kinase N-terminal domain-containing protein [Polaromonas sp.]
MRARLLTLLLPGIAGLLALDSSNDYQALQRVVNDAYDEAMLDSEIVLRRSVSLSKNGPLQLDESFADRELLLSAPASRHKYFHIGLTPHPPDARNLTAPQAQKTLLGHGDLPPLPAEFSAAAWPLPAARPALVWYGGVYRGSALRIVASRSLVADEQGQVFELLVQVAEDQALRDQAHAPSLQQALARDARMFVLVIVLVWLGIAWSLQPLEQLRVSVLRSRGAALAPLDTSGVPHEVAPLVQAINGQIARYAALLARQTQFLTDASHQLKTPLAIMMTQAEVALREKDPALLRPTLHAIVAQVLRSTRLCQQLLSLAHANDQPPSEPGLVDLNTITKDVVLQHLALAHEKNQDLGWIDARDALPPTGSGW